MHLDNAHEWGNQAVPGVGPIQPRRPWPDFNTMLYDTFDAISNYNSLQVKVTKRLSKGFQALVSYTFSKALDENGGNSDFVSAPQNDNNQRADYSLSDINIKQRLVLSPVWQLPFGQGQPFLNGGGLVNSLVGGWELSAIITLQDGFPFSVLSDQDFSNTGAFAPMPDRICNGAGPQTVAEWFNVNCFSTDALAQALANGTPRFGNARRNILIGPGTKQWDVSVIKRNPISEKVNLEFRAEFFNIFNHPNFGTPGATIGTSSFGQLTSAASPRDIQFGLKLQF
jgi:hypothetical protein